MTNTPSVKRHWLTTVLRDLNMEIGVFLGLASPNEADQNGEKPAGVADALFEIARALNRVAKALEPRERDIRFGSAPPDEHHEVGEILLR